MDDGGITFEEAEEVFVCKMGIGYVKNEDSFYPIVQNSYENGAHTIFHGEIVGHYIRKWIKV